MKKKNVFIVLTVILYIGFALTMVLLIKEKRNYHLDEVLTFVLANNTNDSSIVVIPEADYKYNNPADMWIDRITVQPGHRFDFRNVWEKQAADNHPPFYYVLINVVSSLIPGRYTKWIGGSINILLGLLALFFFGKLARRLIDDDLFVLISSGAFALSAGVLTAVTYYRMYLMAMLFVIMASIVFLDGLNKRNFSFYLKLFLVSIAGTLTHYYFFIYLFVISLAYGIFLIIKKEWKHILFFIVTMAAAGSAVYLIFPGIIRQTVGGGYRGGEVISNFGLSDLPDRIKQGYAIVDGQLFGGLFTVVIIASLVLLILSLIFHRKESVGINEVYKWIMLWGSGILYFIIISKVTVYMVDRYFFPTYGILILMYTATLFLALNCTMGAVKGKVSLKIPMIIVLIAVLGLTTFKNFRTSFYYLYRSEQTFLDEAKQHNDSDCLYIYNASIQITPGFVEASNYGSVTFKPYSESLNLDNMDINTSNGLVVIAGNGCDVDVIAEQIKEKWPELNAYYCYGGHSYTNSFYFYDGNV